MSRSPPHEASEVRRSTVAPDWYLSAELAWSHLLVSLLGV